MSRASTLPHESCVLQGDFGPHLSEHEEQPASGHPNPVIAGIRRLDRDDPYRLERVPVDLWLRCLDERAVGTGDLDSLQAL